MPANTSGTKIRSVESVIRDLLARERELYGALRKMVSRELESIVLNKDMDELLAVLEEKHGVIARLQLLLDSWSDTLSEFGITLRRGDDGFWDGVFGLLPDGGTKLSETLAQVRETAQDLVTAEDKAIEELKQYSAELRAEIAEFSHGKHAAASYIKYGIRR